MKKQFLLVITSIVGMNMAFAQPIVKVWGSDDSLAHVTQIRQCLEYLDVRETVYVSVLFSHTLPGNLEGMTFVLETLSSDERQSVQIIKVRIDAGLTKVKQRLVLAHEMIHIKQITRGDLVFRKQEVIWKGRKYHDRYATSQRAPWEREAYRLDNKLAKISEAPMLLPTASLTGY